MRMRQIFSRIRYINKVSLIEKEVGISVTLHWNYINSIKHTAPYMGGLWTVLAADMVRRSATVQFSISPSACMHQSTYADPPGCSSPSRLHLHKFSPTKLLSSLAIDGSWNPVKVTGTARAPSYTQDMVQPHSLARPLNSMTASLLLLHYHGGPGWS